MNLNFSFKCYPIVNFIEKKIERKKDEKVLNCLATLILVLFQTLISFL